VNQGIVIKSTGSRYRVLSNEGDIIECVIRGTFRVKGLRTTNPVAVGDNVIFKFDENKGSGVITEILQRKNYKESQIIAANIDQVFLMITIILPATPVEFIDRFLITAEAYRIPARIIINKTDLYGSEENERMEYLKALYEKIGYECYRLSISGNAGMDAIKEKMKNKISLLAGNSGVGKSTLLNSFDPSLNLKTEEISGYHKQGKHITTYPEMHRMPFGGFVIDTPGIKGFGVVDMERNEIYHFFPEIFLISKNCRYYNCLHLDEPGCAVREAVEKGIIDPLRYRSYVSILEDENRKYR
jgi:ribosome biogenesis GTPase